MTTAWRTLALKACAIPMLHGVLALAFSAHRATAQVSDFTIDRWLIGDGLPQNSVTAIAPTPEGYLMLGTWAGPVLFDGARFTRIAEGLPNKQVTAVHASTDGTLWFGLLGGQVARWRQGEATFPVIESPPTWIQQILEDGEGRIWIQAEGWIGVVEDDRVRRVDVAASAGDEAVAVTLDTSGAVVVATPSTVCRDTGGGLVCGQVPVPEDLLPITSVGADPSGGLWIAGLGPAAAVRVAGSAVESRSPCERRSDCWPPDPVRFIPVAGRDDAWMELLGDDVLRVTGTGLTRFRGDAALTTFSLVALYADDEGSVWIGTDGGGLFRLRERRLRAFPDLVPGDLAIPRSMVELDDGTVVVANGCASLVRIHDEQVESWSPFGSACIRTLLLGDDGSLWAGTELGGDGVLILRDGVVTRESLGTGRPGVRAMHLDSEGRVWVGVEDGRVHVFDGPDRTTYGPGAFGSSNLDALAEEPGGRLWIGSNGEGLSTYYDGHFEWFGPDRGLTSSQVAALHVDRSGSVWIGTSDQGLFRYRDDHVIHYDTVVGLPDRTVTQILEDDAGNLWVGTNRGVSRLARTELDAVAAGALDALHPITLDRGDGLPSSETVGGGFHPAGLRTRDGRLWFSTLNGVAVVDPADLPVNDVPPTMAVEGVRVDRGSLEPASLGAFEIPTGATSFEIEYTAFSMVDAEKVRFRYRLAGFQDEWVEAGPRRVAYYTRMRPGIYSFEVLAANNDGLWADFPAQVTVRVEPYLWETAWFRALAVLALVSGTAALTRWIALRRQAARLEALERDQELVRERERIARDLHDDMGSRLTRLAILAEAGGSSALATLPSVARGAARAMDELVWSVDARHDSGEGFAEYAARYAEEQLEDGGVRCRVRMPSELSEVELSAEVRRHLFLAFKESINNVLKHAEAEIVRLQFGAHDGHLEVEVADDGRGFDPATTDPTRNGLRNMRSRLEAVGGTVAIEATPVQGTRLIFRVPTGTSGAERP